MSEIIIAQRMYQRRDTAANWTSVNPILQAGEIGVELPPTAGLLARTKMGDGTSAWTALPYQAENRSRTVTIIGGVVTLNGLRGEFFNLELTADATLAFTNPPAAGCLILKVKQMGAFTLTLPASVTPIGAAYVTTASGTEVLGFMTMDGATFDLVVKQP